MVTVQLSHQPLLSLTADGHAGAAPKGEDVVCAGISTLLFTLEQSVRLARVGGYTHLEPGHAELCVRKTPQTEAAFAFAETGLRLLAAQYPQHLRLLP